MVYSTKSTSTALLIASNVIILILALVQKWNVADLIWIYWFQSVFIGFFTVANILTMRHLAPIPEPPKDSFVFDISVFVGTFAYKLFMAGFFIVHFGGFHVGYAFFLKTLIGSPASTPILIGAAIFMVEQWIDFVMGLFKPARPFSDINLLFTKPYIRILPMHFVIFIIAFFYAKLPIAVVIGFLLLKTVADVLTNKATTKA